MLKLTPHSEKNTWHCEKHISEHTEVTWGFENEQKSKSILYGIYPILWDM